MTDSDAKKPLLKLRRLKAQGLAIHELRILPGEAWAVLGETGSGMDALEAILAGDLARIKSGECVLPKPLGLLSFARQQARFEEASGVILDHINILTETANEFSTFAKLYTEEPTRIELDKLLREEISMFDNKENIRFDYLGLSDVVVEGPKPQLTRVFVNLLGNAVQAIGDAPDGHIVVSLRKSVEDGFWDIVVEDNGPGVSEENVERLFTPNFTTKNGGSGLGLAISRSILERCGASIS